MSPIANIPESSIPPSVGRGAGIGEASRNVLIRFVVDAFNRIKDGLSATIRHGIESTMESLERPLIGIVGPVIDDLLQMPELPAAFRGMLESARSGSDPVGVILLIAVAGVAIQFLGPAAFSGLAEKMRQGSYNLFNPNLLDFSTWYAATLRNAGYDGQMLQELAYQGWTEQQVAAAKLAAETRLGVQEILTARIRGVINDGVVTGRLSALGIPAQDRAILAELTNLIPGPSDLVRFGLREVWRDDVAAAYGYDEGRPVELTAWLSKQGYGPEWAQAFWRSHWEIPSTGQMIEMFHRNEIDQAQLVQGLKINDVAPGWIDPLLGITYNLLTRVDVKRALRYGEYTIDQVFAEYRQQGYDETRARILTNIAIRETLDEAAGLTRSAVVTAYKKRRMDRAQAIASLEDLGILGDVAEFYLDQADYDRADALQVQRIANVEKRYKAALLTDDQAFAELGALGVGGEESRLEVESWAVTRKTAVKTPTRSNLDEFVRQGILSTDAYRDELANLGYDVQAIGLYVGSLAFESAARAAKEEERAQKERNRVLSDRRASAYEKSKAEIDRDIAELNAAIADTQVALVESQNERDQKLIRSLSTRDIAELDREYKPLFREVDAAIAAARLSIQGGRTDRVGWGSQVNDIRRSLAAGRDIVADGKLRAELATIQTQGALWSQGIAQRRTDIARLTEGLPLAETAEQQADMKQTILQLRTAIAELQEEQSGGQVRASEIDELLPVTLTAARRAELEAEIRALQVQVDGAGVLIADLEEGIRQTQVERLQIESAYKSKVEAVPGRMEQIEISAEYDARIDVLQARIQTLRANVADRRLAKADLVVEWRS